MNIAIIPARGGSKRIPYKNIKAFNGKPMLVYVIEAAQASGLFDRIIVSTDCSKIKAVAESYGAAVPFMRPSELSNDYVGTGPVVVHAIEWIRDHWGMPDKVCCIYPTAPLLRASDLQAAATKLSDEPGKAYAFSVCHYAFPIQRSLQYDKKGELCMMYPEHAGTRSQDLPEAFHDAGQFYFGHAKAFLDNIPTFSAASIPIFLPRHRVIDIDEPEDWEEAEIKHQVIMKRDELAKVEIGGLGESL